MVLGWTLHGPTRHIARVTLFLALLAGWLTGAPSWASTIRDIQIGSDRIVIRFDERVADASAFMLAGPRRIVVDAQGASPGRHQEAGGVVAAIRQGPHGDNGARVVFDLSRPAIVTDGDFSSDGRTLTLRLQTVDNARFARAVAARQMRFLPPFSFGATAAKQRSYKLSMTLPPAKRSAAGLPRIYGADDDSRPLVVIDAGHGGHDPGAMSDGLREKDLTLKIALAIRDELAARGRVRVALTRETDKFLILRDRFGIARRLGANLFISIHCDSATGPDATGATVYTLSEVASDKEAARLATRENKADIIAGVDLGEQNADISSILIDLSQRATMNTSAGFAQLLGREARPLMPLKENFHRMASLMVLRAPDMPSVLFETGYISNPNDAKFLNSRAGRQRIAESVARAVEVHFATRLAGR